MILKFRIRNQQKNTESKSVNLIFQKDELDTKIRSIDTYRKEKNFI